MDFTFGSDTEELETVSLKDRLVGMTMPKKMPP